MSYALSGEFIEACDCTVICPCWVEEDPVGGHCTGLVAWHLDAGSTIRGQEVGGCTVVSVATHSGNRRDGDNTTSALFVHAAAADEQDRGRQFRWLTEAFSGRLEGPLGDLAEVSGTVVGSQRAAIAFDLPADADGTWTVTVRPEPTTDNGTHGADEACAVHAEGHPAVFDHEHGRDKPLALSHTALSHEMHIPPEGEKAAVVAQKGDHLFVNVGALPAGYLEAFDRSGMRGHFAYEFPTDAGSKEHRASATDEEPEP